MQQVNAQRKTLTERVIHAISFEGLATLILAPTAAWLMQRSVVEMGGLSILLATLAMVWNIIYNALFDRLWPVTRVVRTLRVRALHAIGFESGFIIIGVTMVALVLGVSLMQAFMLEIGFMLFLPFLIIDLVVASILMAMGMMMLSPMIVSLPFKLMLFVLVDGWSLIMGTLMSSFGLGVAGG